MRRKTSPKPLARGNAPRTLAPASAPTATSYAGVLERARAMGLFALVTIAPLGLAGSVAACGAARPAEARPYPAPTGYATPGESTAAPMETIAPPAASASALPPNPNKE